MSYNTTQVNLSLDKLYKISAVNQDIISKNISHSIWVNSGSIDLYGADLNVPPVSLSEMTFNPEDAGLNGKTKLEASTNYILLKQNTGTSTVITLTGFNVEDLGELS